MEDGPKQHTSIGEMARECAAHHGTMIVDIDVRADGSSHTHAVATWDDGEPDEHDLSRLADDGCPHHD